MFYTLECHALHFPPSLPLLTFSSTAMLLFAFGFLHIFRHAGDDNYSGDHDDYIRRDDDDRRSADIRSVFLLASFALTKNSYYRRLTARRDVSDKTLPTAA